MNEFCYFITSIKSVSYCFVLISIISQHITDCNPILAVFSDGELIEWLLEFGAIVINIFNDDGDCS